MNPSAPPPFYVLRKTFPPREMVIAAVFVVELVIFWLFDLGSPSDRRFVSFDSLFYAARFVAFVGLAAIGASIVIITGGIDLSVGALFGLCGITMALVMSGTNALPGPIAALVAIAMGTVFGLANGLCVAYFRVPPFIVTLGTMSIARGLALLFTGAVQVPTPDRPFHPSGEAFLRALDYHLFATPGFAGLNVGFVVMVLAAVLAAFALVATPWGRHIHAIGGSEEASSHAGVRVERVKCGAYVLAGMYAGVAGVFFLARWKGINSGVTQQGWELDVIAAAVVGGVSLQGGKGSPFGAVIGALIIKVLNDGLTFHSVPQEFSLIAKGALIIVAVLADQSLKRAGRR